MAFFDEKMEKYITDALELYSRSRRYGRTTKEQRKIDEDEKMCETLLGSEPLPMYESTPDFRNSTITGSVPPSTSQSFEAEQRIINRTKTAHLPTHGGDSPITRRIKRSTTIRESEDISLSHDDPFGQNITKRISSDFTISAVMQWIEPSAHARMHDSGFDVMTNYDAIAEKIKEEILRLAREIVRERKGLR